MRPARIRDYVMKIRLSMALFALVANIHLFAYDYMHGKVKVGDIYYELDEDYKTATVTNSITKVLGEQSYCGGINIPSAIYYEGAIYEVVEIGHAAFRYSTNLYAVTIPNSVKSISSYAFYGCGELTTVVLPEKIRRIEEGTFESCRSLTSIQIGDKVQSIGKDAFSYCRSLETLIVPSTVKKIEYNAFYEVNNVIYKGNAEGSPWGANNINKSSDGCLIFTDKSKTVVASCAKHASGSITIPDGVTKISASAFERCTEITSITLPSTLKYIEYGAFAECSKLEHLTIPKSVQTIEVESFRGCKALTLKIPEKFKGDLGSIDCERIIYY